MNTLQAIIESLQKAEHAATMENMSLGFPGERVQPINRDGSPAGDPDHPTEYVRKMTKLYRESWLVPQIRQAIEMLQANAELMRRIDGLASALGGIDLERIAQLSKGGME